MPEVLDQDGVLFYNTLRAENVLQAVDETKFCAIHGYGGVLCSDCDEIEDKVGHLDVITSLYRNEPRKHLIQLQGGAALLDPDSFFNTKSSPLTPGKPPVPYHSVVLDQIRVVCVAKNDIEQFVLMVHDRCGMAMLYGVSRKDMLIHLVNAERIVKSNFPSLRVSSMLHINDGKKKRTWYLSSTNLMRVLDNGYLDRALVASV